MKYSKDTFLTQRKYTLYILKNSWLLGSKPSRVPIKKNIDFRKDNIDKLTDPFTFRKLLGKLMYLSITRWYINETNINKTHSKLKILDIYFLNWGGCII